MAQTTTESIGRGLESLFDGSSVAGLSDRQLLERYTIARDRAGEAAFAALVARFGPMVLGVCRQLLRDHHHAEDAFQAVFLVLARRAPSIRDPDLLANWLYGVALRTARCAKVQIDRRRKKEAGEMGRQDPGSTALVEPIVPPADAKALDFEQAEALHREIGQLPRSFRVPVVLCYFEGLTLDEAARRLRCPAGTLRSRLARAREKLRRALVRRGVVFPAVALATALDSASAKAAVSSTLCNVATRSAIEFAAGKAVRSSATALAEVVLRVAFVGQLRVAALSLMLVACGLAGVGFLAGTWAVDDEPKISRVGRPVPVAEKQDDARQKPGPGRMFVVGRVLDPNGRPVPDATVMASARAKFSERAVGLGAQTVSVIGEANADELGRFRLEAPRTSSSRNDEFMAIALAPGHGVGWARIDPDADQPAAEISLQPEQIIEGRLLDVNGRPVQGVTVSVASIVRVLKRDSGVRIPPIPRVEGPVYWWASVNDKPAWPKPATTDAEGRFTIHGVSRGFDTRLGIIDPRFALQYIDVETNDLPGAKVVKTSLQPAKILAGRVMYADNGKPVSEAVIRITSRSGGRPVGSGAVTFQTGADGRFRANPVPGEVFTVLATPPLGQPYLTVRKSVEWPKGAVEHSVDLTLARGVTIRGNVIEEGSARPVAGALITFRSHARPAASSGTGLSDSVADADGSFELAVPPGAGHLAILAPTEDYVLREIGSQELTSGAPGGLRLYAHSFVACDPKAEVNSLEIGVVLRRGVTVTGRIIGPDDQPVRDTWIIGRVALSPGPAAWRRWQGDYHGDATDSRFELHGLDPELEVAVYFFEPKRKLGATAHLSGKSAAGGPITIRLEPCGTAVARLVDSRHRPVAALPRRPLWRGHAHDDRHARTGLCKQRSRRRRTPCSGMGHPGSGRPGQLRKGAAFRRHRAESHSRL